MSAELGVPAKSKKDRPLSQEDRFLTDYWEAYIPTRLQSQVLGFCIPPHLPETKRDRWAIIWMDQHAKAFFAWLEDNQRANYFRMARRFEELGKNTPLPEEELKEILKQVMQYMY